MAFHSVEHKSGAHASARKTMSRKTTISRRVNDHSRDKQWSACLGRSPRTPRRVAMTTRAQHEDARHHHAHLVQAACPVRRHERGQVQREERHAHSLCHFTRKKHPKTSMVIPKILRNLHRAQMRTRVVRIQKKKVSVIQVISIWGHPCRRPSVHRTPHRTDTTPPPAPENIDFDGTDHPRPLQCWS